ncbi:MAG: hypothetical protein ACO391_03200, partial [Pseudomonadales bacterium]
PPREAVALEPPPHAALAVDEESRKDGSALPRMLVQGFCLSIFDAVTGAPRAARPLEKPRAMGKSSPSSACCDSAHHDP